MSVRILQGCLYEDHAASQNCRHQKKGTDFRKKYIVWDMTKFRSVLWSDESTFSVTGVHGRCVYYWPGCDPFHSKYIARTGKFPAPFMYGIVSVIKMLGTFSVANEWIVKRPKVTLSCCVIILQIRSKIPRPKLFVQDGAPCHIVKLVTAWLKDCAIEFFSE